MSSKGRRSKSRSKTPEYYEVDEILNHRTNDNGVTEYFVRWEGYGPDSDSWEPEENFKTCPEVVEKYLSERRAANGVENGNENSANNEQKEQEDGPSTSAAADNGDQIDETIADVLEMAGTKGKGGRSTKSKTAAAKRKVATGGRRKKRQPQKFWEMLPEKEADQRDPFWKAVEEGNLDVGEDGLYERVKRRRNQAVVPKTTAKKRVIRKTAARKPPRKQQRLHNGKKATGKAEEKEEDDDDDDEEKELDEDSNREEEDIVENDSNNANNSSDDDDADGFIENGDDGVAEMDQADSPGWVVKEEIVEDDLNSSIPASETSSVEYTDTVVQNMPYYIAAGALPKNYPINGNSANENIISAKDQDQESARATPPSISGQNQLQPIEATAGGDGQKDDSNIVSPNGWQKMKRDSAPKENDGDNFAGTSDTPPSTEATSLSSAIPEATEMKRKFQYSMPVSYEIDLNQIFKEQIRLDNEPPKDAQVVHTFADFETACFNCDIETVRATLMAQKRGKIPPIDLNGRNSFTGFTILMNICNTPCDQSHRLDDIIDLLALNGANLNFRNERNDTALTMAVMGNHLCKVTKLLSLGAAINLPNSQGETPLIIATRNNFSAIVHRLLEHGADFNAQSAQSKTALDVAREVGSKACEAALRNRSANVIQTFDEQFRLVVRPEEFKIIRSLFALHCYALNESNAFRIVFVHDGPPVPPGGPKRFGYLLAIGMAKFLSVSQASIRFWGSTPVNNVVLNDVEQKPVATDGGKFIFYLSPIKQGLNTMVIVCNPDCKQSLQKLLIQAFSVELV